MVFGGEGVVDVYHDQSYSRWIDGTDVIFDKFNETRGYPGSIGLVSGKWWTFKNSSDGSKVFCRSGNEHFYVLSSFYGIKDDTISSSEPLVKKSLASVLAFGPANSRRGSKAYLTSDSEPYGLFWSPKSPYAKDKFLKVELKQMITVSGVFVKSYSCNIGTIHFRFNRAKYSAPANSEKLQLVKHITRHKTLELKLDDSADCLGYQWDVVGQLKEKRVDACSSRPCDHICITNRVGHICICERNYHLFIDGSSCVKDVQPQSKSPKLLVMNYPVVGSDLVLRPMPAIFYEFFPRTMDFSRAADTCREYGGYLPSIHSIFEHRLMYSDLMNHPRCTKWFLGLKGASLMHSAWHDGSWVDFALFEGTVPKDAGEDQVVFMDKELFYMWNYGPASTTQGCVVCQYRQRDCTRPILRGPYKIPDSAWTYVSYTDAGVMRNLPIRFPLDLSDDLQYYEIRQLDLYFQAYKIIVNFMLFLKLIFTIIILYSFPSFLFKVDIHYHHSLLFSFLPF
ncbi:uncharacterized protein LOC121385157 [Gigantopelta aegis]|uniref:uncharacterized protein LOC121385157 n=1 Tax=Gigantopelta aegis TaxID=1735272 RepID=UPI001B88B5D0|nr:uncharacterized protein LOC121385157 [Gigantopelta aegis]